MRTACFLPLKYWQIHTVDTIVEMGITGVTTHPGHLTWKKPMEARHTTPPSLMIDKLAMDNIPYMPRFPLPFANCNTWSRTNQTKCSSNMFTWLYVLFIHLLMFQLQSLISYSTSIRGGAICGVNHHIGTLSVCVTPHRAASVRDILLVILFLKDPAISNPGSLGALTICIQWLSFSQ